ncbi:hypothetical protein L7F22_037271 [Adiantum nelumboides]|nr:hypothetical protein [Adiantum nelumboides]
MAITANEGEGLTEDVVRAGPDQVGRVSSLHQQDEEASMKDDKSAAEDVIANAEPPVIAPDQFNPRYEAKRKEIWAYYSYGVANNGLGLFNFAPTAFQNLLYIAAGEDEMLMFAGQMRSIEEIVLLCNGISCAINVVLFLAIGSLADFGNWRPFILMFWTVVAFGISMAWLGVHEASKWEAATGLYIVGLIVYQMCLSFWTAAFPGLARNTPEMRETAAKYSSGEIDRETYDHEDMMQRNRISNISFTVQSAVEIIILAIIVGIMFGVRVNDGQEQNNRGLSILIAFAGGIWVLVAIPWFIFERRRPGQSLPPNTNVFTAGLLQLWTAATGTQAASSSTGSPGLIQKATSALINTDGVVPIVAGAVQTVVAGGDPKQAVGTIAGSVTGTNGATSGLTGAASGLTGAASGLTGGSNPVTSTANQVQNAASGLTGGSNPLSSVTNQVQNAASGSNPVTSAANQVQNAASGLTGGSNPLSSVTNQVQNAASGSNPVTSAANQVQQAAGSSNPVTSVTNQVQQAAGGSNPVTSATNQVQNAASGSNPVTSAANQVQNAASGSNPVTSAANQVQNAASGSNPVTSTTNQVTSGASGLGV